MAELKAPALRPGLVKEAEFVRKVWAVSVPPAIPFDSVQDPEYWVHCAKKLTAGDRVECVAQDNKWFGELLVAKVDDNAVRMWPLRYVDLVARERVSVKPDPDNYATSFGGPQKWRIVRLSDKKVIHQGEPNEEAAKAWLAEFLSKELA